jgi:peptidoglycan/xylan/chitin deacetylase (PgdA/CDA1 family)
VGRHLVRFHEEQETVGAIVRAAGASAPDGRLLSAVSRSVLDPHLDPSHVEVDGRPATDATLVRTGQQVTLVPGTDQVEGTTLVEGVLAAPYPPGIAERVVWHVGQPGKVQREVGVRSGEQVAEHVLVPAVPPAADPGKVVALTFDDGPWPDTPQFLQVLAEKQVQATFCLVGRFVPARADIVKAEVAAGHTICNHTLDHDEHLDKADQARIDAELTAGAAKIEAATGVKPAFYRPPGGALNQLVVDRAHALDERVIGWTVDPSDWKKPPAATIVATVMAQVKPGAIILLHDGGGDRTQTLAALPVIIDQLRAAGYTFVNLGAVPPNANPAPAPPPPEATAPLGSEGGTTPA